MNWGFRIVLGLGAFMLFIVCAVIYMVSKDSDTLIADDYYEQSLNYDDVYDRKQNLQNDDAQPIVKIINDTIVVTFKTEENKGNLSFKRPSNGKLDFEVPFEINTNVFKVPTNSLLFGNWQMELKWDNQGRKYIHNQSIFIQ